MKSGQRDAEISGKEAKAAGRQATLGTAGLPGKQRKVAGERSDRRQQKKTGQIKLDRTRE